MANDTSSNTNTNPAQTEMDDIMSSIRSGVVEEGGKVGNGSADLIDAAAESDAAEDDVLELSETDMLAVTEIAGGSEELIDLEAFGASGEAKTAEASAAADIADELLQGEAAVAPALVDAADEFDRLLAEISQEQQQQVVASKISKEDLMAEDSPLGTDEAVLDTDAADEVMASEGTPFVEEVVASAVAGLDVSRVASATASRFEVGAIQGPEGVQVAFPAEILAMALRPMVQDWLAKNLPEVVEKLVKEEISKLAQS